MKMNFNLCPASVKQMLAVNNTLKPYGTKYLLPNTNELTCPYEYICYEKNCSHKSGDCFHDNMYPYEPRSLKDGIDTAEKENITAKSKRICSYYGLIDPMKQDDISYNNDIINGIIKHMWDDNRTFFSREYDRIICTPSFRHLQYKTQVMVNSASDDQRTRLLHSLEVQKVAKKIALGVGANWELAETIAIAHDIGHTPFGHEGESSIKHYLQQHSCGVFSHALQSVKVLNELTKHPMLSEYGVYGLGLSSYVLEGVLKHDSDTFTDGMQNNAFRLQYDVDNLCHVVGTDKESDKYRDEIKKLLESKFTDTEINIPQVLIGSVESQIVAWADKIAYLGHDWEEFIDTGLLEKMMSRINDMVLDIEEISKNPHRNAEASQLLEIWVSLKEINKQYTIYDEKNPNCCVTTWNNVFDEIQKIITAINNIEEKCIKVSDENADDKSDAYYCHKYFSAREYRALKNYFIMTVSWVNLLDLYPRTYGLKNDPIYIFYMYLTKIRSNVITPKVTEKLIKGTNDYVETIEKGKNSRDDYLFHCNKLWAYKYSYVNQMMLDSKEARRCLKKTVRTCFLVGFHDKVEDEYNYIIGVKNENPLEKENPSENKKTTEGDNKPKCGYDFKQNYNCMLYLFDCVVDEFINSTRVKFMKHTAQKIITTLLDYYCAHPDMLPFVYRNSYNKRQYALAMKDNIPEVDHNEYIRDAYVCKVRAAADYVADMTDRMAKLKYDEIKSSDTKWSNTYATNLT